MIKYDKNEFLEKCTIITGASRGLGMQIAKSFINQGVDKIVLLSKDKNDLEIAKKYLQQYCSAKQKLYHFSCDISDAIQVEDFAKFCLINLDHIDILVNNASAFGPIGYFDNVNFNEWLETVNTNYIGTARLIKCLLPLIKKSTRGKIINIVGGGASKPYGCLSGYATSKVAIVRFTEELAYELAQFKIDINSLAPGPLNTRFIDKMLSAGPLILGEKLYEAMADIKRSGGTPYEFATSLCIYLASSNSNGISGKLLSARYDDWKNFSSNLKKILKSDIYTLRRLET